MHPPSELMTKTLLPAVRGLIAHSLNGKGMSQSRIAKMLGVTQASVSLYLSKASSVYMEKLMGLGVSETDAERLVHMLCEDLLRSSVEAIYTLSSMWRNLLVSGAVCRLHRDEASITEECDVCMRLYGAAEVGLERSKVIRELEAAVRMIEASPHFHQVMPEVSVNIVMAVEGGRSEADVAAFPGRIVKVRDRARHIQPPEFGASRHMARMLLIAMERNSNFRAAINVKYDEKVSRLLSELGFKYIKIPRSEHKPSLEGDIVVSAFRCVLNRGVQLREVVVDEGGEGLEPVTYIFGRSAVDVAELSLKIASKYSSP